MHLPTSIQNMLPFIIENLTPLMTHAMLASGRLPDVPQIAITMLSVKEDSELYVPLTIFVATAICVPMYREEVGFSDLPCVQTEPPEKSINVVSMAVQFALPVPFLMLVKITSRLVPPPAQLRSLLLQEGRWRPMVRVLTRRKSATIGRSEVSTGHA